MAVEVSVAQDQIKAYVRRVESVEDEIKALNEDKSTIYKEARNDGFDVKILRKVIAARRMDADERREQGEMFELYWDAIHGVEYRVVRAHVENIEEFDADGVLTESQVAPQPARDLTDLETAGQVAPIQPETAARSAEPETASASDGGQELSVSSAPVSAIESEDSASDAGQAPSNLTTFTPKPLRPNCQHPERCGGQGRQHCYSCRVAAEQAGAA